jgi:hypothetical protein
MHYLTKKSRAGLTATTIFSSALLRKTAALLTMIGSFMAPAMNAAVWYVDSLAPGPTHNGTSWADAWTSIQAVNGVLGGDVVYISGGPSGSTQNYDFSASFAFPPGTSGNPVTYQIGQDPLHNGTAVFVNSGGNHYFSGSYYTISGDAGDGHMHILFSGFVQIYQGDNVNQVRLLYLNFGHPGSLSNVIKFGPTSNNVEVGYCYAYCDSNLALDTFSNAQIGGTGFGNSSFHDCTIFIPNKGDGLGADGVDWVGSGVDIYNNTITGFITSSYTGTQHQDAWQGSGNESFIRIHDNLIVNMANSCFFADGYYGGYNHLWIYNNVMMLNSPVLQGGNAPRALEIGDDGGVSIPGQSDVYNDLQILNNLAVDFFDNPSGVIATTGFRSTFTVGNQTGNPDPAVYTNCVIANNLSVNSGGPSNSGSGGGVTIENNNVVLQGAPDPVTGIPTATGISPNFVHYAVDDASNDFHLTSLATTIIGHGANESSFFSTDMDGLPRPATGAWDIGAYQYIPNSLAAPVITTQPVSQTVAAGTNVTFMVAASGTPAPTFQWQKNGANLSGATNATLTLNSVTSADAATYTAVATNSAGSATSNGAVLIVTVTAIAPVINTQPSGETVAAGANVTFIVAANGTPTPTFQWRKNGVAISGATSATLTLNSVTSADAATYTAVATNSAGVAISNGAVLTVTSTRHHRR